MNRRQAIPPAQKYTIKQFQADFPNDDACLEYLMQKRFPGSVAVCVGCKVRRKHHRVTGRMCYACDHCGNHLFPLAGTVFHKSTTSLTTWFYVIKLMTSTRVGISAKQIQRETGVTYKTAWRMMKQIRQLMADKAQLSGAVEMDEAEFGGSDSNKHKHLRGGAKTLALGIVERHGTGRVRPVVIANAQEETIFPVIRENLREKAMIYTDGAKVYENLRWLLQGHKHKAVNHSEGYVDGYAHTNTIDGFWSLVKRGIQGVYYQVGPAYLQSYLNEFAFRYNRRKVMRPMFTQLLERTPTMICPSARGSRLLEAGR
jgi:transposase